MTFIANSFKAQQGYAAFRTFRLEMRIGCNSPSSGLVTTCYHVKFAIPNFAAARSIGILIPAFSVSQCVLSKSGDVFQIFVISSSRRD